MEKGTKIRVTFELELPAKADDPEVLEWLNFELGGHAMWVNNPLEGWDVTGHRVQIERV